MGKRKMSLPYADSDDFTDEPYIKLAHAVILTAVDDYNQVCRRLKDGRSPELTEKLQEKKLEIERFFRSSWFRAISGLDDDMARSVCRRIINKAPMDLHISNP